MEQIFPPDPALVDLDVDTSADRDQQGLEAQVAGTNDVVQHLCLASNIQQPQTMARHHPDSNSCLMAPLIYSRQYFLGWISQYHSCTFCTGTKSSSGLSRCFRRPAYPLVEPHACLDWGIGTTTQCTTLPHGTSGYLLATRKGPDWNATSRKCPFLCHGYASYVITPTTAASNTASSCAVA